MSESEKDDDGSFLSRWSKRKREAKQTDLAGLPATAAEAAESAPVVETEAEEPFDLSTLPKLEEVTQATDISVFLHKGVPEGLRNAVLRKSWALDPAIRNYVNPALDYAFDWNTPGGVPGNSEIEAGTDIAKMVLQIMGSDPADDSVASEARATELAQQSDAAADAGDFDRSDAPQTLQPDSAVRLSDSDDGLPPVEAAFEVSEHARAEDLTQSKSTESSALQHRVRRHGAAKPRV